MHYDPFEVFVATGIRNFKPPLLAIYREYIKNEYKRSQLHHILQALKEKGYKVAEPKYKTFPRGFEEYLEAPYAYLAKYGAIYAYQTFKPDDIFYSEKIIDRNFKIYEDMLDLHQWVYELTCVEESISPLA